MSEVEAYPRKWDDIPGMTLRDYFAGQAISILPVRSWDVEGKTPDDIFKIWAKSAYTLADAMLEARDDL